MTARVQPAPDRTRGAESADGASGASAQDLQADCSKASEGDIRRGKRTPRVSAWMEPARLVDIEMAREGLRQYPDDIGLLR